jgi:predicted RNase H-like HicB family nuclease
MENLSVNISVREEKTGGKRVFIVNNEETGVADFGDTLDEAIENFKKSLRLFLEAYPEKKEIFIEGAKEPIFVSRILL